MCYLLCIGSSCDMCRLEDPSRRKSSVTQKLLVLDLKRGHRFPLFPKASSLCDCWSLAPEKAAFEFSDSVFAVACHLFRFLFSGRRA